MPIHIADLFHSSLASWFILGAVAGIAARWLLGDQTGDLVSSTVIGMLGALAGGAIYYEITGRGVSGFDPPSLAVAFVGSCILLLVMGFLRKPQY